MKFRIDTLIGGPKDGEVNVVQEDYRYHELYVLDASLSTFSRDDPDFVVPVHTELYIKHTIAFQVSDDECDEVEFFAHQSLSGRKASELVWRHMLQLFGARLICEASDVDMMRAKWIGTKDIK